MLPPPEKYDEVSHKKSILERCKLSECVVFDGKFCPLRKYFVACNNSGKICVWNLHHYMTSSFWEGEKNHNVFPLPNLSFQAHESQIYTLQFMETGSQCILLSGGDEDIRIWNWNAIISSIPEEGYDPIHLLKPSAIFKHQQQCGSRGMTLPLPETNDIAVNDQNMHIFSATGDKNAYEWDLNTGSCVQKFQGHSDYLHSTKYTKHAQQLITGSEDGTVRIWDARTGKSIDTLKISQSSNSDSNNLPQQTSEFWVGTVSIDESEAWMVCGGGKNRTPGTGLGNGFCNLWHLPSRLKTLEAIPHGDVHDAIFKTNEIITVGNQSTLQYWNRRDGTCRMSVTCSSPSNYFVSTDKNSEMVASGGCSRLIDIFTIPGIRNFSLQFC